MRIVFKKSRRALCSREAKGGYDLAGLGDLSGMREYDLYL